MFGSSPDHSRSQPPRFPGRCQPIPQSEAKAIADRYGYDQVIVIARGPGGAETLTTFARTAELCRVVARLGTYLQHEVLAWLRDHSAQRTGGRP